MIQVTNMNDVELLSELLAYILTSEKREMIFKLIPDLPYLDVDQACDLLDITLPTLNKYRDVYDLPYIKIGRRVFYREEDIWQLMESVNYNPSELKYRRLNHV